MGWTCSHRPQGQSIKDFLREKYEWDNDKQKGEVLDLAVKDLRTAYIAVRNTDKQTGCSYVWGLVCLISYHRGDYYNTCVKEVTETMGPMEAECPEWILKLLTSLDDPDYTAANKDWAREWRECCWNNIKRRNSRPRLRRGMHLRHPEGIRFANGETIREFQILNPRSTLVADANGLGRYRVTRRILAACEAM